MSHIVLIGLYNFQAFGVRTLFTILKSNGYNTTAIFFKGLRMNHNELPSDYEIKELISLLKKISPDIIGISLISSFFDIACMITKEIRQNFNIPILWGGTHPTLMPDQCIAVADMICIGEGDEMILDLARALKIGKEFTSIRNLWIRTNKSVIKNVIRPLIQDLDKIPILDHDNDDKYYIEYNRTGSGDPVWGVHPSTMYTIMASRGCPFQCTYCSNSILKEIYKNNGSFVRKRSVNNVIQELSNAKEKFILHRILFEDEVIVSDKKWVSTFCERYKNEICLPFSCKFHPATVSEEILSLLVDAGLDDVIMGIQTGSERIRKEVYKRTGSNLCIKKSAELFHNYGINPCYDIILDNPYETRNDKRLTIEFLLSLPRPYNLNMYSMCWFPQTKLTTKALSEGIITKEQVEGSASKTRRQWRMRLDQSQKEDQFWNALVLLCSLRYNSGRFSNSIHIFPKWVIHFLMHTKLFLKHPKFLTRPIIKLLPFVSLNPMILMGIYPSARILRLRSILRYLVKGKFRLFYHTIKDDISFRRLKRRTSYLNKHK